MLEDELKKIPQDISPSDYPDEVVHVIVDYIDTKIAFYEKRITKLEKLVC